MTADVVLVGGGLANSLIAYRLATVRPELQVVLIERGDSLGGRHVWSFHDTDLTPTQRRWVAPLVARSWSSYEVRFPGLRRRFASGYSSVTSTSLDVAVRRALGERTLLGCRVTDIRADRAELAGGRLVRGRAVLDGRGAVHGALDVGFQKFLGLHLELERPHGLEGPILMDATVDQCDGFRFLYTLPFTETTLLVEDTRYSDGAALDRDEMRLGIAAYSETMGWRVRRSVGEEEGVLPVVLSGDIAAFWARGALGVPRTGMRAALFHPTTGYSLPEAVRLADRIAASERPTSHELFDMTASRSKANWRRHAYFRRLNRMLFRAAAPAERWRIMERFHRLPEPLIQRFYADRLTRGDRIRILSGRPPVSPLRALAHVREPRRVHREGDVR